MILNTTNTSEAEYIGSVQENTIGIDAANISFITQLLTSSLYSKPLESFLRETVANAYDSHIEAGTDEYIIVLIKELNDRTYRISVRDFGTGLSPERFDEVYKNIGGSTKRKSNDFIGALGLGRLAVLSLVDAATVTSYYEGKKYVYMMYKNNGGINIDRISVTDTDLKNGVEISADVTCHNTHYIIEPLYKLMFFEKVYVEFEGSDYTLKTNIPIFNGRKIIRFNNFAWCNLIDYKTHDTILMGNILYPASSIPEKAEYDSYLIPMLPIGGADIIPSREALQYTEFTKNNLQKIMKDGKEELNNLVHSKIDNKNFTLEDYYKDLCGDRVFVKINEDITVSVYNSDISDKKFNVTINNKPIPENFKDYIEHIQYNNIDKYVIFMSNVGRTNVSLSSLLKGKVSLYKKVDRTMSACTKQWFKDTNFNQWIIVGDNFNITTYLKLDTYSAKGFPNAEECMKFIAENIEIKTVSNSDVPTDYIEEFRNENKKNKIYNEASLKDLVCRQYYGWGYKIRHINVFRYNMVFYTQHSTDVENELTALFNLTSFRGSPSVAIITVKKEYIGLLENCSRCFDIKNITLKKHNFIAKILTAYTINQNLLEYNSLSIRSKFLHKYDDYAYVYVPGNSFIQTIYNTYIQNHWLNEYDIKYYNISDTEKEAYHYLSNMRRDAERIIEALVYKKYGKLSNVDIDIPEKKILKYIEI